MKILILTNNPLVKEKISSDYSVEYYEIDYVELLKKVRDRIHLGHKLLTHPLSGSVKPNETPYKSVAISCEKGNLHIGSLEMIESGMETANKFLKNAKTPNWSFEILEDFKLIDYNLIKEGLIKKG